MPSPASSALGEHISAQIGSLPSADPVLTVLLELLPRSGFSFGPPLQKVHLFHTCRATKFASLRGSCGAPKRASGVKQ